MARPVILKSTVAAYDKADGTHVSAHERPTYVHRKVLNGADIHAWAVKAGFKDVVPADKMHVTVAYSKQPVDRRRIKLDESEHDVPADGRKLDRFDGDKATVLRMESEHLRGRFKHMLDAGASWDFRHTRPQYKPHVTVSYNPDQQVDHKSVEPYKGPIKLGPEVAEDLKTGWSSTLAKAHIKAHTRRLADGRMVQVAAHSDRRASARLADGQLALFPKPAPKPMGPNPYRGLHPVDDTPDLFDGLTPKERAAQAAPAPAAPAPAKPTKPHPLDAARAEVARREADVAHHRDKGDEGMADFARMGLEHSQRELERLQVAFDAHAKHGDGLELSHTDGQRHVVFLPDVSSPGKYRYQMFDKRGMMSHSTHDTPEEAVAEAARDGFTAHNPGVLDRLASTEEWEEGMAINALIQKQASGLITYPEFVVQATKVQEEFAARRKAREKPPAPTDTPEFKRWFSDSKVVDADGKPARVFHGTSADFSEFDAGKAGANFGMDKYGIFFADKPNISAHSAAAVAGFKTKGGDNIMPVYLAIKNPLVVKSAKRVTRAYEDPREIGGSELFDRSDKDRIMAHAKAGGHDGIRFEPGPDGDGMWIAFSPHQIKSATGNRGTFDPSEADITKSFAPATALLASGELYAILAGEIRLDFGV